MILMILAIVAALNDIFSTYLHTASCMKLCEAGQDDCSETVVYCRSLLQGSDSSKGQTRCIRIWSTTNVCSHGAGGSDDTAWQSSIAGILRSHLEKCWRDNDIKRYALCPQLTSKSAACDNLYCVKMKHVPRFHALYCIVHSAIFDSVWHT